MNINHKISEYKEKKLQVYSIGAIITVIILNAALSKLNKAHQYVQQLINK